MLNAYSDITVSPVVPQQDTIDRTIVDIEFVLSRPTAFYIYLNIYKIYISHTFRIKLTCNKIEVLRFTFEVYLSI